MDEGPLKPADGSSSQPAVVEGQPKAAGSQPVMGEGQQPGLEGEGPKYKTHQIARETFFIDER